MTNEEILKKALIGCFQWFACEEGWEWFRAEMLSGGDKEYQNVREKHAEAMRRFVRDLAAENPVIDACLKEAHRNEFSI